MLPSLPVKDKRRCIPWKMPGIFSSYAVVQRCPAGKAAESQPLLTALAESLMLSSG